MVALHCALCDQAINHRRCSLQTARPAQRRASDRVRSLENDLAEERNAGLDNKRRASEIERLQTIASRARAEAEDFKRGAIKHQGERETWARERERLETALRDKEDR